MAEERIPDRWRQQVVAILAEGHYSGRIEVSRRAFLDFQALFPGAFPSDMYEAFINALSGSDVFGRRVRGMSPEGETYAFIFVHLRKRVYGKVCLTVDGRVVVIFSAHGPLKGETA